MVGECAYWGGYTAAYEPFKNDTKYSFKSWKDVYNQSFDHAQTYHFNTLDLRTITETKGWTGLAPELVRKFVLNGGYRVYPTYVIMPYEASAGQTVSISHSWRNTGYGYLPNNMKNWNYKYKPAFALFDESGKLVNHGLTRMPNLRNGCLTSGETILTRFPSTVFPEAITNGR